MAQDIYAEYDAEGWPSIDPRSPDYCYQTCVTGVHVCGHHPDGMNCLTIANFPRRTAREARALFEAAKAECAVTAGEPDDFIVDLMIGGDIAEDFPMSRQMLTRLSALAA